MAYGELQTNGEHKKDNTELSDDLQFLGVGCPCEVENVAYDNSRGNVANDGGNVETYQYEVCQGCNKEGKNNDLKHAAYLEVGTQCQKSA